MSAEPEGEVTAMRDFLQGLLEEASHIDGILHAAMRRLRERIHALDLAEDETFVAEHKALSDRLMAGDVDDGLTAAEFAEAYSLT